MQCFRVKCYCVLVLLSITAVVTGGCIHMQDKAGLEQTQRPQVEVIAHRGASAYAPENTLAAFELAVEQNADWFELDCYLSQDGIVVVLHDTTVDRTTNGSGAVQELTLAELKTLDAGSWKGEAFTGEPIPTLFESLELAKGRIGVYVEVKNSANDAELVSQLLQMAGDAEEMTSEQADSFMEVVEASDTRNLALTRAVIEDIRSLSMENEVVIQSFSSIICFIAKHEAPEIVTELLGSDDAENPQQWINYVRLGEFLNLDGINPNFRSLTPERLQMFHDAGRRVAVWTINSPEDMETWALMGVDAIITDYPDVCLNVLEELNLR